MLIFESLRAPYRPQDLAQIEVWGGEHLPTSGGVLLSGHFGNIELLGSVLGRSGHEVADLAWRAEDPLTQFVDQHRRAYGIKFIYTSGSVHARARAFLQAERLIEDGYMVAFMIDSGASGGLEMEFLGRPRKFDLGGELLARRTQRPLAARFITRTAQGHLVEILSPPSGEPTRTVVQLRRNARAPGRSSIFGFPKYGWLKRPSCSQRAGFRKTLRSVRACRRPLRVKWRWRRRRSRPAAAVPGAER